MDQPSAGHHRGLAIVQETPVPSNLPTVRALEELWREVQAKPLWAPPNFWRYLRLRRQVKLRRLRPETLHVSAPLGKVNDCRNCTDSCCIGSRSTVLLHLRDIATLIDTGHTDWIAHSKPDFDQETLVARPALRRHIASSAWHVFPVLKQNSFGACAALTIEGRCALHPHWPLSCARFPYALHLEDGDVFYSPRCDAFWIRPDARRHQNRMALAAVAAYNERIKDWILLAYARSTLKTLGVLAFVNENTRS